MQFLEILKDYAYYLTHPFKTHQSFLERENDDDEEGIIRLSPYESLGASWIFVVFNGIVRIFLLNIIIIKVLDIIENSNLGLETVFSLNEIPSYSFFVLSAVLDVIFYPLFGIILIQYWEFILKMVGKFLQVPGDLTKKSQDIISVSLSSYILRVVPIFGSTAQSIAHMVAMYAGLRVQMQASAALSICVILTPVLMMLMMVCLVMLLMMIML